jgi:hypothetical protein
LRLISPTTEVKMLEPQRWKADVRCPPGAELLAVDGQFSNAVWHVAVMGAVAIPNASSTLAGRAIAYVSRTGRQGVWSSWRSAARMSAASAAPVPAPNQWAHGGHRDALKGERLAGAALGTVAVALTGLVALGRVGGGK